MFIEDIFRELRNWTSEIVEKFEFPAGYPEWTMAGHLALAAHKAGFPYILQDYIVPKEELCHSKQQSRRTRPDLYIQNRGLECLIELKRCNIDLEGSKLSDHEISNKLKKAWKQVNEHSEKEVSYLCTLVGVIVDAYTREWKQLYETPDSYDPRRDTLWDKFKEGAQGAQWEWKKETLRPNFCCGYFLSHEQATSAWKAALKYGNNNEGRGVPFPVGMLWSGLIRRRLPAEN
jgi:hypothetical protein